MSASYITVWLRARDMAAPSWPSPVTSPRQVTGCSASSNPTSLQARALRRPEPGSSSSAKRETRLTGNTGLGVNAAADSEQAHAGSHGEYMIHDETIRRANRGRRTKATEGRSEKTMPQPAVPATASLNCAAKRKTTAKTIPLTTCAFIHDVSPLIRCEAACSCSRSPQVSDGDPRRSKAAPEETAPLMK